MATSDSKQTLTMDTQQLDVQHVQQLCKLMRHWILESTHAARSGHPTSAMSAVELLATLFFAGHFRFNLEVPAHPLNDRLIFSKGHASPIAIAIDGASKPSAGT